MSQWNEQEIERLEDLRGSGLTWEQIGAELDRNPRGVKSKFERLRESGEFDWNAKAREGSAKLLNALMKHHRREDVITTIDVPAVVATSTPPAIPEPVAVVIEGPRPEPTVHIIKRAVAKHFGVHPGDLSSARRTKDIVYPRQVAFYLCKMLTPRSYPDIGRRFGGKDHSTVIHAFNKIEAGIQTDPQVANDVAILIGSLKPTEIEDEG